MMERTQNLRINADRLWDEIMRTARIGGTPKGGTPVRAKTRASHKIPETGATRSTPFTSAIDFVRYRRRR